MEEFETLPPPSETTIAELKNLCNKLNDLKAKKSEMEAALKEHSKFIGEIEHRIIEHLKENGLKDFRGEWGNVFVVRQRSVLQPRTMEDKIKLFDYLKEIGIFNELVAVNSKTLSSWAKKEIEAKEKEGVYGWIPPGLEAPNETMTLAHRKS